MRGVRGCIAWALLTLSILASCDRKEAKKADEPIDITANVAARGENAAKQRQDALRAQLKEHERALLDSASQGRAERRAAYANLAAAARKADGVIDASAYRRLLSTDADEALAALDKLAAEVDEEPTVPEKPIYEAPRYTGAFALSGAVRRCYNDGVLLQSRGKYYFVAYADCPTFATSLHGVVEYVGDTVEVDIGRDGRDAEIVKISNRESMADDRAMHAEDVREAKAKHQAALREYQEAAARQKAWQKEQPARVAARNREQRRLYELLDHAIAERLRNAGAFVLPAEEAEAGKSEMPIAEKGASQPTVGKAAAPSAAARSESSGTAADGAFLRLPVQKMPTKSEAQPPKAKPSRASCVRACVAKCNDDASCERGCVAAEC